jgi:hypothetical protein
MEANLEIGRRLGAELDGLDPEVYVTTERAAAALDRHPETLKRWRRRRQFLAYVQIGGVVMYRVADIQQFLRSARVNPIDERSE